MKTIRIINSEEQIIYNEYFKPFMCTSDIDLPQMYNQGYNCFRFIGQEPEFIGENMPEILKSETNNYKFYECQIQVMRNDGSKVSGFYYKTVTKNTGEIKETFSFD